MIEIIEGLPRKVVGIAVKGRVTMQDCRDVLMPAMKKSLKRHDKIRLYYELSCRFPGAAWDDLDLGIEHASRCERVAIVTDVAWVRLTVKALRFLIPGEIRVFATIQAPEGRAWITARPGSRTSAEASTPVRAPSRRVRRSSPASARSRLSSEREQTGVSNLPEPSATRPAPSPPLRGAHDNIPSNPVDYATLT
jgi:hypothetical protein